MLYSTSPKIVIALAYRVPNSDFTILLEKLEKAY